MVIFKSNGQLDLETKKAINVIDGTSAQDAITKTQLDTKAATSHTHTESDITDLAHKTTIDSLSDVTITTPADNEVVAYDTTSSEFINQTASEAGLSASGHTHTESDVTDLDHTDTTAVHDNVSGEISLITEKATPVNADLLIIEDSAASNAKKKVQVGNLPGGGAGEANTASNVGTAGVGIFKQKTGVDLELKKVNAGSSKITVTDDVANNEVDIDVAEANIDHDALTNFAVGEHRVINDAGTATTELWSASKINTDLGGKSATGHTHTESDVTDLDHNDTDAIHDNVSGEISLITEKVTPVNADLIVIEDSAATNAKKKVQIGNLPSSGASQLSELSDVNTSTPTSGNFLRADGVDWESAVIAAGDLPTAIDAVKLADGTVTNAELQYINSVTSNVQTQIDGKAATSHNHTESDITDLTHKTNIASLDDVTITTVTDNEVLAYDTTTSEFINQTPTEAGLASASHNHAGTDITSSVVGVTYGGTGINSSTSTGIPKVATGTWTVDATQDDLGDGTTYKQYNPASVAITGGTVSGITDLAIADGGTGGSTATVAFDALAPTTTKGDIIVNNGTDNIREAVGTNDQVLTADSAQASGVKWATAAGGTYARSATLVIASSTSKDTTNADYICDGTADQTEIESAMNALPAAGGTIVLMEGTFNCSTTLNQPQKDNITIRGMNKRATEINLNGGNFTTPWYVGSNNTYLHFKDLTIHGAIQFSTNSNYVTFENVYHYGSNRLIYNGRTYIRYHNCEISCTSGQYFIYSGNTVWYSDCYFSLSGTGKFYSTSNVKFTNCEFLTTLSFVTNPNSLQFNNCRFQNGLTLGSAPDCTLTGNNFRIATTLDCTDSTISGNHFENTLIISGADNTISGNYIENLLTVSGVKCAVTGNRIEDSIYFNGSTYSSCTGNTVNTALADGVYGDGTTADYLVVVGNIITGYTTNQTNNLGANSVTANNVG